MMKIVEKIKSFFKNADKKLLFLTIFMLIFGLINIITASSREATVVNKRGIFYYFYKQLIILSVGFVGSMFAINVPTSKYYRWGKWLYFLAVGLIGYCFFMSARRGAQNWILLPGGFQFQPSEFAKIVIIICLSIILEKFNKVLKNPEAKHHKDILGITFVIALLIPILIFLQKDLGTATIISSIVGMLFIACPVMKKEKLTIVKYAFILLAVGCIGLKITKGYILTPAQFSRLDYLNPCSKYETGGYQICNAYIAFNDGGLFGLGVGKSKQKYSYIPEPHTDSIFAIIGEEWGVLKCFFLVFIPYALILYRILNISSKASTLRGKYICLGVATYLFMHILINLGGLLGLIPLTGVPLPFLSYGGTYTICLIISLSLVQRVYIETKTKKIKL